MTGQRFGRWIVLEMAHAHNNRRFWLCRCDCGTEKTVVGGILRNGNSKSCGCLNRELQISRPTTHGMTGTRIHAVWFSMRGRCENPADQSFKNYGGRGIKVCERWQSFANFYADMGPTYAPGLTIDRRNNDGDYEPTNCQWLPRAEQSRNRRLATEWKFKSAPISTNTSGIRGVSRNPRGKGWVASICINRKQKRLGLFATKREAAQAYQAASASRKSHGAENPIIGRGISGS